MVQHIEKHSFRPAFFKSRPISFFVLGWMIFPLIYWYLKTISEKIEIAADRVTYTVGIISKDQSSAKIDSIRSIRVKQGIFERIFGVGDIEIFTAGDEPEFYARGFVNPNQIKELLEK